MGCLGRVAADESPRAGYDDAQQQLIRARIREGLINDCVVDEVARDGEKQFLVFHNQCDAQVNVMPCVREQGGAANYFQLIMQRRSDARQQLLVDPASHYDYTYGACDKANCTAPSPNADYCQLKGFTA